VSGRDLTALRLVFGNKPQGAPRQRRAPRRLSGAAFAPTWPGKD
jgi:hypothetical protein